MTDEPRFCPYFVLDASEPGASDPKNWLPAALINTAVGRATGSFVCTLWVGEVKAHGLHDVIAGTHQTCTGSFRTQWTQAQFASERGGWHRITDSIIGEEELLQGTARPTQPGDFPADYWD
ncbi:protein of unknown function [Streptomyces murinus]|uniref:hypothetical protein n=1 Tax=Streptomyces murinus TaxID=33900 RepID=UPI003D67E24C